jgi:hypothetical protein
MTKMKKTRGFSSRCTLFMSYMRHGSAGTDRRRPPLKTVLTASSSGVLVQVKLHSSPLPIITTHNP